MIYERCNPVPKIMDVMNYADSIGLRLACVTNGSRVNAIKMLYACGLLDYFEFIITREDVDGLIKPHPRPYLEARYRMGLGPKEALVIDDTERGIMSGVDACCRTWRLKNQDNLSVSNLMRVLGSYKCPL
jgi:HAD superfamily hydrolase (TIGR01509 family)